jgi:enamine deaminase RidA (YjgF/YER057c/UK114 family)
MNTTAVSTSRTVKKYVSPGFAEYSVNGGRYSESFLTFTPVGDECPESVFSRAARHVRSDGRKIVTLDVLGLPNANGVFSSKLEKVFGSISWPVTWIEPGDQERSDLFGVQIWTISGAEVERLIVNGIAAASIIENDAARYIRIGGVLPQSGAVSRGEQTRDVFEQVNNSLHAAGMTFHNVARTWFYADKILTWYGEFNAARTGFFHEHNVFQRMMPASTGIGASNGSGKALIAGAIAFTPKHPATSCEAVDSPLQGSAASYGSSFSRAVELREPNLHRLYISGTASIDPDGKTAHLDDMKAQVKLTMDVAGAILTSRGMNWKDVSRAIAYVKHSKDYPVFEAYCRERGLTELPVVSICADVCRDDLLFEIEVDAIKAD